MLRKEPGVTNTPMGASMQRMKPPGGTHLEAGALGNPPFESWLMRKSFEGKGSISERNLAKLVYSKTSHSSGNKGGLRYTFVTTVAFNTLSVSGVT